MITRFEPDLHAYCSVIFVALKSDVDHLQGELPWPYSSLISNTLESGHPFQCHCLTAYHWSVVLTLNGTSAKIRKLQNLVDKK